MADVLPADLVVLYQDAFFNFDTDKDGVITIKQLGPLLRMCGENPTEADIQVSMGKLPWCCSVIIIVYNMISFEI